MAKPVRKALPHIHDYEGHVRAVEEDLEYYRAKRFEPRMIYLARRGVITFYDILKAQTSSKHPRRSSRKPAKHKAGKLSQII